jgi:two-component system, OmpR family, response regulator
MDEIALKILLIDDSPLVLERTARVLSGHGWTVECAGSPIGCSGRILRMAPDVILLDVEMPALSGPDFLAQLRGHASIASSRVLFYSDLPEVQLDALAKRTGADGYVCKSTAPDDLVRRVRDAAHRGPGPSTTFLIVDRERWPDLEVSTRVRQRQSFVKSGHDAIVRMLGPEPPDLVVCSMDLPDMSGLDVHAMARAADPSWTERFLMLVEAAGSHPSLQSFTAVGGRVVQRSLALPELARLIGLRGELRFSKVGASLAVNRTR